MPVLTSHVHAKMFSYIICLKLSDNYLKYCVNKSWPYLMFHTTGGPIYSSLSDWWVDVAGVALSVWVWLRGVLRPLLSVCVGLVAGGLAPPALCLCGSGCGEPCAPCSLSEGVAAGGRAPPALWGGSPWDVRV